MKTETIEASGGIGVVTVGQDVAGKLPILLIVHGAKLTGGDETVRAELTREEARKIIGALLDLAPDPAALGGCDWCGS